MAILLALFLLECLAGHAAATMAAGAGGRQLLQASGASSATQYPGRPIRPGQGCTSRGHKCLDMVANKPYHVLAAGRCETARAKQLRDRFGRPLTIRYTYNKQTFVANREQVCELSGRYIAYNRSSGPNGDMAEHIDDYIWKNLSIWAREYEHKWELPAQKEQYVKCHAKFASWHCSSMFPNCTAELEDKKPALPCKELCEETKQICTWGRDWNFLPYELKCTNYPSKTDRWKKCTTVGVTVAYKERIAGTSRQQPCSMMTIMMFVALCLRSIVNE